MGVVQGFCPPNGHGSATCALDRAAAELFLRAQCAWLRSGLSRISDPTAVGLVLAAHDSTHASWIALIGRAQSTLDATSVEALVALYGYLGTVAGALERGLMPLVPPAVQAALHEELQGRLMQLTDHAIAALDAPDDRPAKQPAKAPVEG